MKEIQPISIWYNGLMVAATIFNLIGQNDNLSTSASFTYELYSADNTFFPLASGQLTMSGDDYITYSSNPDSNNYAYSWGATQLNITLV
jgi:hypothetical protein